MWASTATETTTSYVPTSTTLTATGTLNVGTIVVKDWYNTSSTSLGYTTGNALTKGFNCVGNLMQVQLTGIISTTLAAILPVQTSVPPISFLNPNGSYGTYSSSTHMGTKNGTHIIPSGVGFFVQATGTSPKLTFTEGAKQLRRLPEQAYLWQKLLLVQITNTFAYK